VKPMSGIQALAFAIFIVGHVSFFIWVLVLRLRK